MSAVDDLIDALAAIDDTLLTEMTAAEFAEYQQWCANAAATYAREHEDDWSAWLKLMFPDHFRASFAEHHEDLWRWVWSLELGVRPAQSCVAVFPRGGAKSTSAEAAVAALGARRRRRFGLYVCATQQQADDHVGNVAALLESHYLGMAYPDLGSRAVSKYGTAKGWRRNRLRTASGLTVDALGLDTAARGIKVDEFRPDLLIFDDIDEDDDGPGQIERKTSDITNKLLPTGDQSLAVLVIQNIPNPDGIVAQLAGVAAEPAEFLRDRLVIGPVPAVEDATFEDTAEGWKIIDGRATWDGQSIERCNQQIAEWGITAFRIEAQHETDARGGGMFDHVSFRHCGRTDVPDLVRKVVWVDPAVTDTKNSDAHGCVCDGIAADGTIYRLRAWERRASPGDALKLAIVWATIEGVSRVGIETDQGGDTWSSVYREALQAVRDDLAAAAYGDPVTGSDEYVTAVVEASAMADADRTLPAFHVQEKAGSSQLSKAARAQQMLADYERPGRIVHVLGTHLVLERGLRRFPRVKPFDVVDAAYWSWRDLRSHGQAKSSGRRAAARRIGSPPLVGAR